jgi:hypothetical protein
MITAINKKNQSLVNKASKWLIKYNVANELRDVADDNGDDKDFRKYDNVCEKAFGNYLETIAQLPKREVANINKLLY